jgi:hypothetical protein
VPVLAATTVIGGDPPRYEPLVTVTGARRGAVRGGEVLAVVGGAVAWRETAVVGPGVTGRAAAAVVAGAVVPAAVVAGAAVETTGVVATAEALTDADRAPDAACPANSV